MTSFQDMLSFKDPNDIRHLSLWQMV